MVRDDSPDDDDEVLDRGEVLSVRQPHAQGQGLRLPGAADDEILKIFIFYLLREIKNNDSELI